MVPLAKRIWLLGVLHVLSVVWCECMYSCVHVCLHATCVLPEHLELWHLNSHYPLPDSCCASSCWAQCLGLPGLLLNTELGSVGPQEIFAKWKNGWLICPCILVSFFLFEHNLASVSLYICLSEFTSLVPSSLSLLVFLFALLHFSPHDPILETYTQTPSFFPNLFS